MAKGNNNIKNKKPHSTKPYDVSNSFVKKVTSGVSSLLPQNSWISRWFAPTSNTVETAPSTSNEGNDQDNEHISHSPPTKRARIPLHRTFPPNSFRVSSPIDRGETHPWPSESLASPIPNVFSDSAVAGPSGLSRTPVASGPFQSSSTAVEGLEGKINGDGGSDSSESTSGCSSLAPQRPTSSGTVTGHRTSMDNKMPNHVSSYSLFPSATHKLSSSINPSLSRRRPSFNVSSFGSPNLDTSKLSRESSLNSPFYIGRTMYGGASAYRRPREGGSSESFLSSTRRGGVTVRPANEKTQSGASAEASMSQTARRILEALEQFSSPVSEARRMPLASQPALGAKRKRPLEVSPGKSPAAPAALTTPLTIPMAPERLRLHRLQDATEAARRIASSASSVNNKYTLRSGDDGGQRPGAGKVTKSKPLDEDEQPLPVNLPHVSLPITTLPSFDLFKTPIQSTSANSRTHASNAASKLTAKGGENSDKVEVEKSKIPCAISSTVSSGSSTSIVESSAATTSSGTDSYRIAHNPVNLKGKVEKTNNTHSLGMSNSSAVSSFMVKGAPFSTVRADSDNRPMANDYVFSTPTVLPSSRSKESAESKIKKFDFCKPEVLDCAKYSSKLRRNEPNGFHKLCSNTKVDDIEESVVLHASCKEVSGKVNASQDVECITQSSVTTKSGISGGAQNNGWGAKFSVPDSWECSSCMVRNKNDVMVCVCCGGKQPSTKSDSKNSDDKNCVSKDKESPRVFSGWSSNFALQPGMWECSTCLVQNNASDDKCVACTASRPGAAKPGPAATTAGGGDWSSQFKLTAGKWECSACLVRNEDKDEKCVSCTTPRNAGAGNKKSDASVGDVKTSSDWGQKFKKPSDSWECPVCMIQNKCSVMKCAACQEPKPGIDTNRSSTGGSIKFNFEMPSGASNFKFGIDKAELKQSESGSASFMFGGSAKTETAGSPAPAGFTFGASSTETKIPSGIKFGTSSAESSTSAAGKPISKVGESNATSIANPSAPSPTTGAQKPLSQSETSKVTGFSFGIPVSSSVTSVNENIGEPKKIASLSDTDSSRKDFKFTVSQTSPVVSSADDTEKKGAAFVAPLQKAEQKSTKEVKPSFNFGAPSTAAVTLSTTTTSSTAGTAAVTKSSSFSFSSSLPSSGTTASVATSTVAAVAAPISSSPSSLFSFGNNSTCKLATTSAPTFSFGSSNAQTTSSGIFGATSAGQFKPAGDGLFSNKSVVSTTNIPVFGSSSASSAKTVPTLPSFGSVTSAPDAVSSTTTTNISTFGTPTSSVFASPSTTTAAVAFGSGIAKPTFASVSTGFGSVTTAGVTAVSTAVSTTNAGPNSSSSFSVPTTTAGFGIPVTSSGFSSTNVPTFGSSSAPTGFGLASTTTSTSIPTSAPTPSFGTPAPVAFGASATTGNCFGGANATQSFNTTASSVFGSSNPPSFGSAATTPAFGATATAAAAAAAAAAATSNFGNSFGGATTTAPTFGTTAQAVTTTSSAPSLPPFGGFSSAAKPAQGIFLFGSNPTTTAQSSNFSFNVASQSSGGQGALSGSAAFSFGSGATSNATNVTTSTNTTPSATAAVAPAPAPTFGGFSFTGGASAAAPGAPTPSLFGNTAPATPVFGAPSMPTTTPSAPAFGGASATNNSVFRPPAFNFASGGTQQPFSFGSSAQPGTAQSTGFSFGQGQPPTQLQSQPLHFNPNMRPTFNFTGGETPQFTASTPASTPPQRRVKKAVRRAPRQ